jgi:hypothetical protein
MLIAAASHGSIPHPRLDFIFFTLPSSWLAYGMSIVFGVGA